MKRILLFISFVFLLAACTGGCKEAKKITIKGTVTRDGQALDWKTDKMLLLVTYCPIDRESNKDVYLAESDPSNGTYVIRGIPPGEYLVAVQQMDPAPGMDRLGYKFELGNSPIRKEVKEDGQVIDIDIPKDLPPGGGGPKMPAGTGGKGKAKKKEPAQDE